MDQCKNNRKKILTLFGTRPEIITLAPVIQQLESRTDAFQSLNVTSSQHTDLHYLLIYLFGIRVDRDLSVKFVCRNRHTAVE